MLMRKRRASFERSLWSQRHSCRHVI